MKQGNDFDLNQLYEQLINGLPIHIYWKDTSYRYIYCNQLQAENLGFKTPKDIVGKSDFDILSKEEADILRKNDKKVIESRKAFIFEEVTHTIHGKLIFLTQKIPITLKNKVVGIAGISINITARKKIEEKTLLKLRNSERALNDILDNLPGHVYWKDKNGVFLGCNRLQVLSAGFTQKSEIIGKTDDDLPWKADVKKIRKSDQTVMETEKPISTEEKAQVIGSSEESVFLSKKAPLHDARNKIIGVIGVSFDITDRKKMENDLILAKEKAELSNQAKSDFISNMEHDLRTPFTGIRGIASLLCDEETDPDKKSMMELMMQSCQQWETVHNRIFDALVAEHETLLEIEPVSIRQELIEIQEMMAATLHVKQLEYRTDPIPTEFDMINTDKLKFRLILSSLISNAIKFTVKGSIRVHIAHERNDCVIQVTDTGIGVPVDKLDYIFEKFTKLSRSNKHASNFQGVGLGLYVAKQYVTQLGGTIQVESKLNEGSIFTVKLPLNLACNTYDS